MNISLTPTFSATPKQAAPNIWIKWRKKIKHRKIKGKNKLNTGKCLVEYYLNLKLSTGSTGNGDNNILFPEFELVTEPEDYDQLDEEENRATEHQETKETTEVDDELDVEELEKMAMAESQDDRQFAKFKKRIQHEPDQVQYLFNLLI